MPYETIKTDQRGRVGIVWLNRPDKLNAMNDTMHKELIEQITSWNSDRSIGAIVITGEGRAFCSGYDMGGFEEQLESGREEAERIWFGRDAGNLAYRWPDLMRRSKPTVAAVNGYALGVGLTAILGCDIRIAAEGAQFSMMFVKVGLMPELASTRMLPHIVGFSNALDLCLSGRRVRAQEALSMGLVNAVVPQDRLLDAALERANELANNPTNVVLLIKELLWSNPFEPDLDKASEREEARDKIARESPAHREALTAFGEKREPRFNE